MPRLRCDCRGTFLYENRNRSVRTGAPNQNGELAGGRVILAEDAATCGEPLQIDRLGVLCFAHMTIISNTPIEKAGPT